MIQRRGYEGQLQPRPPAHFCILPWQHRVENRAPCIKQKGRVFSRFRDHRRQGRRSTSLRPAQSHPPAQGKVRVAPSGLPLWPRIRSRAHAAFPNSFYINNYIMFKKGNLNRRRTSRAPRWAGGMKPPCQKRTNLCQVLEEPSPCTPPAPCTEPSLSFRFAEQGTRTTTGHLNRSPITPGVGGRRHPLLSCRKPETYGQM